MLRPPFIARAALRCPQCARQYATRSSAAQTLTQTTSPGSRDVGSRQSVVERQVVVDDVGVTQPRARVENVGAMMRTYKPRTPGVRHLKRPINDHLHKGKPLRKLTIAKKGHGLGGRNNTGRITVRHRGGGAKRRIRTVDFMRMTGGRHTVDRIEYDPNRSAHIALVTSEKTKAQTYILAAEGMRAGDEVHSYRSGLPGELIAAMGGVVDPGMLAAKTALRGNCMPIRMVPLGAQIYSIGSRANQGAVFCRSAGTYAIVISKDENRRGVKSVTVRLQSGELRRIPSEACATIGVASNPLHHFRQLGKAGRSRWLGIRPTVRGVAMNAVDHPHGGGRGKSKGNRIPTSPWGTIAKSGFKTRPKRKENKFLVKERPRNQGRRRNKS